MLKFLTGLQLTRLSVSKFLTGLRAPVCVEVSDWFAIDAPVCVEVSDWFAIDAPVCVNVSDWLARGCLRYAGKDLRNQRTVNQRTVPTAELTTSG